MEGERHGNEIQHCGQLIFLRVDRNESLRGVDMADAALLPEPFGCNIKLLYGIRKCKI